MEVIDVKAAREYVMGNYPNDPLLKHIAVSLLEQLPKVEAVEVKHGRWEQVQRWATKAKYRCSVCGREIMSAVKVNNEKYPHCHCGAKMDGDGNG